MSYQRILIQEEIAELGSMPADLEAVKLEIHGDSKKWIIDSSGALSVRSLIRHLAVYCILRIVRSKISYFQVFIFYDLLE